MTLRSIPPRFTRLLLTSLFIFLSGCASFQANVDRGRSLADVQRFFVVSNLNDNHAVDHQIAESLRAHGRIVEVGPLTMMPDDTQAVVTFKDQWTWDFRTNLVYLTVAVRDTRAQQAYATATFSAKVPLRDPPPEIVNRLVTQLLNR